MPVGRMPDVSPIKYLLQGVNKNMIINPYRFATGGGGETGLLTDLEYWWDMSEVSGNAIASVGGINLIPTSAIGASLAPDGGNARNFGGSAHFISASDIAFLGTTPKDFTIAFWFSKNSTAAQDGLVGYDAADSGENNIWTGGNESMLVELNASIDITTANAHNFNQWYSCILTNEVGVGVKIYMNTVEWGSISNQWNFGGNGDFTVGSIHTGASEFEGQMCSLGIWSRVFDASDRSAFYNGGVNLRYANLGG